MERPWSCRVASLISVTERVGAGPRTGLAILLLLEDNPSMWQPSLSQVVLAAYLSLPAPQAPKETPRFLHAEGTRILDGEGNAVKLRGVNLGGWLLWVGRLWGGGYTSETEILNRLKEGVGAEETEKFRRQIHENYVSERDLRRIAELGFNVVRVPINHTILEDDANPFVYKNEGWELLDRFLAWCEKYRVYAVLDLHAAPGGQSKLFMADPDDRDESLWKSERNQKRTVELWRAIATRYKDRTVVAGYDILNEPAPPSDEALVGLYGKIVEAIRSVDTNHIVFLEGTRFSSDFSAFSRPLTQNQVYSFHMYGWLGGEERQRTKQSKTLDRYREISRKHNVPFWNGEFGENTYEQVQGTVELLEAAGDIVQGYCFWTWKAVPGKFPYVVEIPKGQDLDAFTELLKDRPFRLRKKSTEGAREALQRFVRLIEVEPSAHNSRMTTILNSPTVSKPAENSGGREKKTK
jgi:aryl-phospho-beta-D-glucosidase BglC (GH1 family)